MAQYSCPHCGKEQEWKDGAAFCPYCGGALGQAQPKEEEPQEALELARKAQELSDPKKRFELLTQAQQRFPDSLAIARELLFLGRLHQRTGRDVDFSVIKCHLWMLYLKPKDFSQKKQEEMRREFFDHPQLDKCLELSPHGEAFLREYLVRLGLEFIRLFLRGDSVYMRRIFGFGMDSRAPKLLADPVSAMIQNIRQDGELPPQRQELLAWALYQAFTQDMAGETKWLEEALRKEGLPVPRG